MLCAAVGAVFLSVKHPDESPDVVSEMEKKTREDASISSIISRSKSAPPSVEAREKADQKVKTKSSDREADSNTSDEARRKKFWRGAILPDDLVAASLPVLQAAIPPASNGSEVKTDFAISVPVAFADEESFDFKRANEELYLWLVSDPQAASAWLSGQSDYSKYSMAFALVADAMGNADRPDIGEQWTNLIANPAVREDALVGMYAGMYSRRQPIPEHIRQRVLLSDRID